MEYVKGELHFEYSEISDAYIVLNDKGRIVAYHSSKANAAEMVRRWNAFEEGGFVLDLLEACELSSKLLSRWKSGDCDNKAAKEPK